VSRLLFVDGLWVEKFGIMSLIPTLESAGFEVRLLLTRNKRRLLRTVGEFKPRYVAFSVTTGYHTKALEMAHAVHNRFPEVKVVFGGPHVTYFPQIAQHEDVDIAVRGECDREFPEILRMIEDGAPPETIPNLIYHEGGGEVAFGPLSPLVEDLDSLPLPDRHHFYRYRLFRKSPYKAFIISRGCPNNCSFCFNHKLRCMYRGKGRFVRLRSPESVVDEALRVKRAFGMKLASFEDDLLTHDLGWLERLLTLWKERVGVPYNLNATGRALTNPDLVRLLKQTGVWCVAFGLESGDEKIRRGLLNKPLTDHEVRTAGELLRREGVRFLTYNMFALPQETFQQALETIRLNREIGTRLARYTLFQPYPGTQLADRCDSRESGRAMLYRSPPYRTDEARKIEILQKYALLGMLSPWGERAGMVASRLPGTPLNDIVFWATYFNVVRRYMRTSNLHLLELGLRSLTDIF